MNIIEILLIIACALIVIGTVIGAVIRKKKGRGGCCGADCKSCTYCPKNNDKKL
ncbi:MAG: hypothetical protein PHE12_02335 [Clostridia bacterium]|nr:hypothetical protein [Clostridia bacterium]